MAAGIMRVDIGTGGEAVGPADRETRPVREKGEKVLLAESSVEPRQSRTNLIQLQCLLRRLSRLHRHLRLS